MGGSSLVIAGFIEALREEVVGKFYGMCKAVDAFANIEVDPTIARFFSKAIFLDEFERDVGEVEADIFKAVEWGVEVEVADVKSSKAGIETGDNTVKDNFGKFKGAGWNANIARVANALATDGDASEISIVLVWLDFTHYFDVCDPFAAVTGDVVVCDE